MPRASSTTEAGSSPHQHLVAHSRDLQAEPGQTKTKAAGGELDAERQRQADAGHPATGNAQQDQEAAKKTGQQQDQGQQKEQNKDQKAGQKDQADKQPEQKDQKQQKSEEKQKPPPAKKSNQPDESTLTGSYQQAESKDQGDKVVRPWASGASNEMSTKETTWSRIIRQGQEQGEVELRVKPTDRVPGSGRTFGERRRRDDDSLWGVEGARDEERGLGGLRGFASQKWGELTGGRQDQNQSLWGMSRDELFDRPAQQRNEFSDRNLRREFNEYDRFKADDSDWRRSNLDRFRTSDRDERRFRERDEDDKGTWEKIKEKGQEWKEDAKEWMDDKLSTNRDDDNRQSRRDRQFRDDRFKDEEFDRRRVRGVEDRLNRVEDRLDNDERRFRRFDRERQFRERDEDDKGTWEKIKEKGQEWKEDAKEWMDDKFGQDDRSNQSRSRSSDRFYDRAEEVEDITAGAPVRRTSLQPVVEDWKERQRGKAEEWKEWSQDKSQELKGYAKDKRDEWKRDAKDWKQEHFPNRSEGSYRRQRDEDDRSFRDERRFRERDEDDKGMWEKIKEKGQEWKEDAKEWVDDKLSTNRDDDRRFNERRITDDRRFTDDRRSAPREESDWRRSRGTEEIDRTDRRFDRGERRFRERDEDDKGMWEKVKEKGQEWKEDAKEWVDDKFGSDNRQPNLQSRFYRDDIRAGAPVERASFSNWMDQQQEHARNWEKMKESGAMFREPEYKLQQSRFRLTERYDPTTEMSSSAEEALTDHTDAFVEDGFLGLREIEEADQLEANAQSGVRSFIAGKWFDFTHDKQTVDRKYDDLRNRRDVRDWQQRTFEQQGLRGASPSNAREQFNNLRSRYGESANEQSFNSRFSSPSRMPVEDRLGYRGDIDDQFNRRSSSRGRNFDSFTGRTFDERRERGDWNDRRFDEEQFGERRFSRSPLRNDERRGLYSWEQSDAFGPKADFMSDAEYRTWDRYRLKLASALKDRNAQIESDADLTGLMEDTKVRDEDWYNQREQERKNEKKGWFGFGNNKHNKREKEERDNNRFNATQEETKPLDISSWFKNTDEGDNRSSR